LVDQRDCSTDRGDTTLKEDNIIGFKKLEATSTTTTDLLTEIAKHGAREMLAAALGAEVQLFLESHQHKKMPTGKPRLIRNGYLPERPIQTGIGSIEIKVPRVRDRAPENKIKFTSSIVPRYLRRSKNINEFLPLLYLKGISRGAFQDTLTPLFGEGAKNLSSGVIGRLKSVWEAEYHQWHKRDLSKKRYVYWWVDGIYLQARMEDAKDCVLVIIGVNEEGQKELLALEDGFRESKESWLELINHLKKLGLRSGPEVATGDGALGFWAAMRDAYPKSQHQRCWVHKTANVLDKLPRSLQSKAKADLHEIWMSETRINAYKAFDHFVNSYCAKYPKATECLLKDKEALLTFYDFPAEHWKQLRTSNPIESTFATVRHRTKTVKGCFSRMTILTMVFKLCESAQKRWVRLNGFQRLAEVIRGVKFVNGESQSESGLTDKRDAA
jgi:putative transposase